MRQRAVLAYQWSRNSDSSHVASELGLAAEGRQDAQLLHLRHARLVEVVQPGVRRDGRDGLVLKEMISTLPNQETQVGRGAELAGHLVVQLVRLPRLLDKGVPVSVLVASVTLGIQFARLAPRLLAVGSRRAGAESRGRERLLAARAMLHSRLMVAQIPRSGARFCRAKSPEEISHSFPIRRETCDTAAMSDWMLHDKAHRRTGVNMKVYSMSPLVATEFDHLVDFVGPLNRWPVNIAEAVVSTHLTFESRFQLTLFLLGNRVPPCVFTEWFLKRSMLKDASARRHVAGILLAHKTGKLEADSKTTWVVGAVDKEGNELKDKNQVIATPDFAQEEPQYWDEAIKKLQWSDWGAVLPANDWLKLQTDVILPYRMSASVGATVVPGLGPIFGLDLLTEVAANSTPIASPMHEC